MPTPKPAPEKVIIEIIQGVEGPCISLNSRRIAGSKPWGGGKVVKAWTIDIGELVKAVPEIQRAPSPVNAAPVDLPLRVKLINLLHKHGTGETAEKDGEKIDEMVERIVAQRDALLSALQELIPAQDDFDSCAGRLEGEQMNESGPTAKTRAYFREAKTRLLKARDAARDAEARAAEATK